MDKYIIKSSKIQTPEKLIDGGLLINGKQIEKILEKKSLKDYSKFEIIDMGDNLIIPGLIDIHIHGSGGWAAGAANVENVEGLCKYLPSVGVTSFQPTLGGEDRLTINKSLRAIREVMEGSYNGARMLGIHMEGPFLNPEEKGAFIVENLLEPSVDIMKEFIESSGGNITHMTVAPEIEGAKELIEYLVHNNILVAGGHTNATIEETKEGIKWGVSLSTHTCNAQRSIHHREPGALGAYLLDDEIYCELICDLFHVHPDMIELILRLKSTDRVCMISDAIIGSGLKPGIYEFSNRTVNIDEEGWSRLPNGTIAGSTKSLLFGFKNMVQLGYKLEDVVKMSSHIPAKLLKVEDKKGSIEEGKDADLVVLDKEYNVIRTYVEGKLQFNVENDQVILNDKLNK
ncbi:MAG: N-acetylglucosamine-6-phosphate deacetylase [Tissierellia bacterium]|nr:N-acetylglucosamine-6-phosphate deacetylase [Tissierellia bacterium]